MNTDRYENFLDTAFVDVKGAKIRFAKIGQGEPVLFLHGFPETLQTWRLILPDIAKKFQAIALDLKGFGYSDKPQGDYSPQGMADFVKDYMEVSKIDKAHVVATDTGLTIACAFALKYPDRINKLVLMSGTAYDKGLIAPEVRLLAIKPLGEFGLWLLGPLAIGMGLKKGFYKKGLLSPKVFNEYYEPFKDPVARKRTVELLHSFFEVLPDLGEKIKDINVSTLILWAEYERFFSLKVAKRLQKDIKNSRLEIIPSCGHFIQEEKPEIVTKLILSFL